MKILVTGSREFSDEKMVHEALSSFCPARPVILIHGGASGADTFAATWARPRSDRVYEIQVNAKWDELGNNAGNARNMIMLELNPDMVLAFYSKEAANTGTLNCVKAALLKGISVKQFVENNM